MPSRRSAQGAHAQRPDRKRAQAYRSAPSAASCPWGGCGPRSSGQAQIAVALRRLGIPRIAGPRWSSGGTDRGHPPVVRLARPTCALADSARPPQRQRSHSGRVGAVTAATADASTTRWRSPRSRPGSRALISSRTPCARSDAPDGGFHVGRSACEVLGDHRREQVGLGGGSAGTERPRPPTRGPVLPPPPTARHSRPTDSAHPTVDLSDVADWSAAARLASRQPVLTTHRGRSAARCARPCGPGGRCQHPAGPRMGLGRFRPPHRSCALRSGPLPGDRGARGRLIPRSAVPRV